MWFDIQTWLPLGTVSLAAAICLERGVIHYGKHEATPCRGVTTGMFMLRVLSRNVRKRKP